MNRVGKLGKRKSNKPTGVLSQSLVEFVNEHLARKDCTKDEYTVLINRCGEAGCLELGKRVHEHLQGSWLRENLFLSNHLVKMYGSCGEIDRAESVFYSLWERNVFSWNIMVAAYAQNGHYRVAVRLYQRMLQGGESRPDGVTFVNVLSACCEAGTVADGRAIHSACVESGCQSEVVVATATVSMFGRFGLVEEARAAFDRMLVRNVFSWTAMLTAYARKGHDREALGLYREMVTQGMKPDRVAFISALDACRTISDGKGVHEEVTSCGLDGEVSVMNALMTMYARCGSLASARGVFERLHGTGNEISWSALIAAYAQHGHISQVLEVTSLMTLDGMSVSGITFINILFACSHAGRLDEAWRCFLAMLGDYCVDPLVDHYTCMLDLLARLGHLELAEDLLEHMPFHPPETAWKSLLSGCGTQGDHELGSRAAASARTHTPTKLQTFCI